MKDINKDGKLVNDKLKERKHSSSYIDARNTRRRQNREHFMLLLYKEPASLHKIIEKFKKYCKSISPNTAQGIKNALFKDGMITQVSKPKNKGLLTLTLNGVKAVENIKQERKKYVYKILRSCKLSLRKHKEMSKAILAELEFKV
jgi:hypothetical protein